MTDRERIDALVAEVDELTRSNVEQAHRLATEIAYEKGRLDGRQADEV